MKSLLEVLRHPKRCYAQWGLYPVTGDSGNKFHEGEAPEGVIRVIEGTGTPATQSCVHAVNDQHTVARHVKITRDICPPGS